MQVDELDRKLLRLLQQNASMPVSELAERAGRDPDEILIYIGPSTHPINPDTVAAYAELGVDQLVVPLAAGNLDKLASRAEAMLSRLGMS